MNLAVIHGRSIGFQHPIQRLLSRAVRTLGQRSWKEYLSEYGWALPYSNFPMDFTLFADKKQTLPIHLTSEKTIHDPNCYGWILVDHRGNVFDYIVKHVLVGSENRLYHVVHQIPIGNELTSVVCNTISARELVEGYVSVDNTPKGVERACDRFRIGNGAGVEWVDISTIVKELNHRYPRNAE